MRVADNLASGAARTAAHRLTFTSEQYFFFFRLLSNEVVL
jgi:hypothetical protein